MCFVRLRDLVQRPIRYSSFERHWIGTRNELPWWWLVGRGEHSIAKAISWIPCNEPDDDDNDWVFVLDLTSGGDRNRIGFAIALVVVPQPIGSSHLLPVACSVRDGRSPGTDSMTNHET